MNGLLNLNKPAGLTSRQVVDCVVRLVRPAKAGHAGTLDPLATGVLVVAVGAATRLIQFVHRQPKAYRGTFLLGRRSDTEDVEGQVVELVSPPVPTLEQLREAASRMTGQLLQRPPQFSAVHFEGRRAYELARRGEVVPLKPRPITVYRMEILEYQYPALVVDIKCSSGTYVRSLGRDLADSLGTAAVMSNLVRTQLSEFGLSQAVDLESLSRENLATHLMPPLAAVNWMPRIGLSPPELLDVRHGRPIHRPADAMEATEHAAVDSAGNLVAILVPRDGDLLGPQCVMPA